MAFPIVGSVLGLGSLGVSAFGMAKASQMAKKNQKILNNQMGRIDDQMDDNERWFESIYYKPWMQSEQAQSTMRSLKDYMKTSGDKIDNASEITGASAESKVAAKDAGQRTYADTVNKLAGYGTQYKDRIRGQYQGQKNYLNSKKDHVDAMKMGVNQSQAQSFNNLSSNAMNMFGNVNSAKNIGAFDDWDTRLSAWWNRKKNPGSLTTANKESDIPVEDWMFNFS